jgi:DNA-binding beta-propeller fold protein YncE
MVTHRAAACAATILLALTTLGSTLVADAGEFPYHVLQRISLSGAAPVRALAFSPGGKRLFAAVGSELRAYDTASSGRGPVLQLPGAAVALVAAARDGGTLYVALRQPARLLRVSLRPLRILSSVAIGHDEPSGLLYDAATDALYVESTTGGSIARLDSQSGKTLGVARLHGRLEQMATNGRAMLYVADADDDELEAIETGNMRRAGAIPLSGCTAPSGLATDTVGRRLFVACGNGQALVIDEEMGFPFVRLPIERAAGLRMVFALRPLGPQGWKGGAFLAGDGPALDAIQMKAFINYVDGGSLPLDGRCTGLAVSSAARKLALALRAAGAAFSGSGAGSAGSPMQAARVELWILAGANEGASP